MFELLRLDYFVWIENLCSCEIGFMKLGKNGVYNWVHPVLLNHQTGVMAISTWEVRLVCPCSA